MQVEVFEAQTCAALEVGYYDGASACMALNGQPLGNKPVIASHLIEFPDVELMTAILNAQAAVRTPPHLLPHRSSLYRRWLLHSLCLSVANRDSRRRSVCQ